MSTLDNLLDAGDERREQTRETAQVVVGYLRVGIWSIGWVLAKVFMILFATVAGLFFGVGWLCARVVPVLVWMRAAFMLGWESGRGGTTRR